MEGKVRILLVCSAGMSTSLLMTKMQKSAQVRGINAEIMAMSSTEANKFIAKEHIDVLLLGPQVRYMKAKFEKMLSPKSIPLAVINMQDYGKMNGEKVLETALQLIKNRE
ncbi:PTS sugar transporter subunit IIB [Heyndrickxia acidiproducens]|uniref:PTS sugar transporter subunit IIB n=1 Tax=Heyndrickxia acidiproducens TaxID=1121084 RepID=UPI00035D6207|nr:PTS sugar transporter subunit IIB [Heyndrickxia acidiproducens]